MAGGVHPPVDAVKDRLIAFVVIEAHNLWGGFGRAFYLSCALRARTCSGTTVRVGGQMFGSANDALLYSVRLLKNRTFRGSRVNPRDEPAWHVPANIVKLFQTLNMSNLSRVQAALSYSSRYFELLPKARHFFAHRSESTRNEVAAVARALGLNPKLRPGEVMCSSLPLRPQHILSDWLDDMRAVIEMMCQ